MKQFIPVWLAISAIVAVEVALLVLVYTRTGEGSRSSEEQALPQRNGMLREDLLAEELSEALARLEQDVVSLSLRVEALESTRRMLEASEPQESIELKDDGELRRLVTGIVREYLEKTREEATLKPIQEWVSSIGASLGIQPNMETELVRQFLDEFHKEAAFREAQVPAEKEEALIKWNASRDKRREYILQQYGEEALDRIDGEWLQFRRRYVAKGLADALDSVRD